MPHLMEYTKKVLNPEQHIELLQTRGLIVPDRERAKRYLHAIGYYRLSVYFLPFQDTKDTFNAKISFDHILKLYIKDRKLRLLAMDALERIEVAFRSVISNTMSSSHGPHWFTNDKLFRKGYRNSGHRKLIKDIKYATGFFNPNKRNPACKHYYQKFDGPELPPSWIVAEVLTLGAWSRIYKELLTKHQKRISTLFDFDKTDLETWSHSLTLIRNNCAHHNRFWNHTLPPKATNVRHYTYAEIPLHKPYTQFALIHAFLKTFTTDPRWSTRLYKFLNDWPLDIHDEMGFPRKWESIPFWDIR